MATTSECTGFAASTMDRRDLLRLFGLASLAPWLPRTAFADDASAPKYYGVFQELPVGAVRPQGWLKSWLLRQCDGLSGHPESMAFPYYTCQLAGVIGPPPVKHGEIWWPYEQNGYFFDAASRLSLLVEHDRVRQLHRASLDYILANSTDRGYGASVWGWPNAVIGRGLLATVSATPDAAESQDLVRIMRRYLTTNARTHDRDGVNAEEAFWLYTRSGDPLLLSYARSVYQDYTTDTSWCSPANVDSTQPFHQHGVTAAETLNSLALNYIYTGDVEALRLAQAAYGKAIAEAMMPDGGMVSAENLGLSAFGSLHETCDLTDWSWSMGYCLMADGDARWADRIERTLFNALPGAVTKDFKQAQYFSGANQVLCTSLSSRGRFASTRMSYRAAHDTPCCVGNVSRAMPNYVARQWMKTPQGALAAVLYGPCELNTTVDGQPVTILQQTNYPFRDTIHFTLHTAHPIHLTLQLRIPGWCTGTRIEVNGKPYAADTPAGSFASVARSFRNGDTVLLTLPMQVRLEPWYDAGAMAVLRGPLLYSVDIAEKRVELTHDTPAVEKVLYGLFIANVPAVEFYPESEWRYGVDASMAARLREIKVVESPVGDNPFLTGHAPVHLEMPLRRLPQWQAGWVSDPPPLPNGDLVAVKTPGDMPTADEMRNPDAPAAKRMVPSGSTQLRLTTLPVVRS